MLVTARRRESFGDPFESMCAGLRELACKYRDQAVLVYPVHRNPNVRGVVGQVLGDLPNVAAQRQAAAGEAGCGLSAAAAG